MKFSVHRDVVLDRVREMTGVDMRAPTSAADVVAAIAALEALRWSGLGATASE